MWSDLCWFLGGGDRRCSTSRPFLVKLQKFKCVRKIIGPSWKVTFEVETRGLSVNRCFFFVSQKNRCKKHFVNIVSFIASCVLRSWRSEIDCENSHFKIGDRCLFWFDFGFLHNERSIINNHQPCPLHNNLPKLS